jgi:hypothetical protein
MGTLAEALSNLSANRGGPPCGVEVVLDKLDEQDRETLLLVLSDKAVSSAAIATALSANGFEIRAAVISRHRRIGANGCRCEK